MTHVTHDPWVTGAVTPAQALHRFIDYPALYLGIVYVHTLLSCYIIAHVSKLHHRLTRYIIIATIYKPSHRVKQVAQLSQRDRATHELLRFAKLLSEFMSHPFGGLVET